MASIISAGTTDSTSLNVSGDKTGILQLASNNAVTAVTIDASQNVGIGTTSPSQKLHVNGKTLFATTSGVYEGGFTSGGTNVYSLLYASSTSGTMYLGVNGTAAGTPIDIGGISDNATFFGSRTNSVTQLVSNNTVRATIDTSGNLFVGGTTQNTSTTPVYASNTAKAWVNYNGVAQTVRASFNISSVTYVSGGIYTLNFTNALVDSNYILTFGAGTGNGRVLTLRPSQQNDTVSGVTAALQSTTQVQIQEIDFNGGTNNSTFIFAAVFR